MCYYDQIIINSVIRTDLVEEKKKRNKSRLNLSSRELIHLTLDFDLIHVKRNEHVCFKFYENLLLKSGNNLMGSQFK